VTPETRRFAQNEFDLDTMNEPIASFVADPRAGDVASERSGKLMKAHQTADSGVDPFYGRRLYADLCARGLVDIGAEGRSWMGRGAAPSSQGLHLSYTQMREVLLGAGELDAEELEECLALFDDPNFVFMHGTLMAAWGRRPGDGVG
jgi:hypothetical protein